MIANSSFRRRAYLIPCAAALLVVGCGPHGPPMAPVHGKVIFDGRPLNTGTVVFIPNSQGPYATGEIQPDGTYSLSTHKPGDGAVVGSYRIMVSAHHSPNGPSGDVESLLPAKYGSDRESGLTAEVRDQPENTVDLTLVNGPERRSGKR